MTRGEFEKLCYEGNKLIDLIDGTKLFIDEIENALTEKESIINGVKYFDFGEERTARVPISNDLVITALKSTLEKEKIILSEAEKQFSEL